MLLVLPIQSVSDVITNSSSELFVLQESGELDYIEKILENITEGFQSPIRFSLKDYREALAEHDKRSPEIRSAVYYIDPLWSYGSYHHAIRNWFTDLEDEDSLLDYRLNHIEFPWQNDEIDIEYKAWVKNNNYDSLDWEERYSLSIEFLKTYSGKLPSWWMPENTLQELDGKVLVLSESDNSIPYDSWELISDTFGGYHIHLG